MKSRLLALFACLLWVAGAVAARCGAQQQNRPPLVLKGRLEEMAGRGASLPVGLTVKGLQRQSPHLVPETTGLPSFPPQWAGDWGGHLQVTAVRKGSDIYQKGETGIVIFHFAAKGARITLRPADIFFAPKMQKLASNNIALADVNRLRNSDEQGLDGDSMRRLINAIVLGDTRCANLSGSASDDAVLLNSLRKLNVNVLEENIVVARHTTNAAERGQSLSYQESVLRFTPNWQSQALFVQAAYVEYDASAQPQLQLQMQGWVQRDWKRYAGELETLSGRSLSELEDAASGRQTGP